MPGDIVNRANISRTPRVPLNPNAKPVSGTDVAPYANPVMTITNWNNLTANISCPVCKKIISDSNSSALVSPLMAYEIHLSEFHNISPQDSPCPVKQTIGPFVVNCIFLANHNGDHQFNYTVASDGTVKDLSHG